MGGHYKVIKFLVTQCKVDVLKKDNENKTGLEHAWQNGHTNLIGWLSNAEQKYTPHAH